MQDNENLVSTTKLQQKYQTKKMKDGLKKSKTITIRVSEDQRKKIKDLARTAGKSLTQFMIGQAFEHPNFDRMTAGAIRDMDWITNDIDRQEDKIIRDWKGRKSLEPEDIEELFKMRFLLTEKYGELKSALYKSYLTDLEAQKLTKKEKKKAERECQKRLIRLGDKLKGR